MRGEGWGMREVQWNGAIRTWVALHQFSSRNSTRKLSVQRELARRFVSLLPRSPIPHPFSENSMARWPRHVWTSIYTYSVIFILFPLLCLLAYAWVRGWI